MRGHRGPGTGQPAPLYMIEYIYIYTYIYIYVCTSNNIYIQIYIYVYICRYIHLYIYTYICTEESFLIVRRIRNDACKHSTDNKHWRRARRGNAVKVWLGYYQPWSILKVVCAKVVPRGLEPRILQWLAVCSNQLSHETDVILLLPQSLRPSSPWPLSPRAIRALRPLRP